MVKLKSVRTARRKTQAEVASALGMAPSQLGKYERGWEPAPLRVLRDLAVFLECDVTDLTGEQLEPNQWRECEHSILDVEEPYGGIYVRAAGHELEYPISLRERNRVLEMISELDIQNLRDRPARLLIETLNAKWVLLNVAHIRKMVLRSDDDHLTPYFAHPEVYHAVSQNTDRRGDFGPVLQNALQEHYDYLGAEKAEAEVGQIKLLWQDGSFEEDLFFYDEWVATALFGVELTLDAAPASPFVRLDSDGPHEDGFYNLDQVAVLEVPLEDYRRMTAPEE